MRVSVVKTRPAFDHGRHIRRMGATLGMWFPFYLAAYTWHRFGPTKSVSYQSTEGLHTGPPVEFYRDPYTGRTWWRDWTGNWSYWGQT